MVLQRWRLVVCFSLLILGLTSASFYLPFNCSSPSSFFPHLFHIAPVLKWLFYEPRSVPRWNATCCRISLGGFVCSHCPTCELLISLPFTDGYGEKRVGLSLNDKTPLRQRKMEKFTLKDGFVHRYEQNSHIPDRKKELTQTLWNGEQVYQRGCTHWVYHLHKGDHSLNALSLLYNFRGQWHTKENHPKTWAAEPLWRLLMPLSCSGSRDPFLTK